MTPVLQTAVTGLIWALSVSLVMIASAFCTAWLMKIVDDKNAQELEWRLEKLRKAEEADSAQEPSETKIQNERE